MARVENVTVGTTTAYQVTGPDGSTAVVKNLGPDSCFFATASTVSSGSNDGTLTSGSSLAFSPSKFFISSGSSILQVTTGPESRPYDKDNGQTGMYAPSGAFGFLASTTALTASRAYFVRFVPSRNMTVSSIAFQVTTGGADVACDVGIYSSSLARLAVSTAAASRLASTGVKNIALTSSVVLTAGVTYYAAFSSDVGSTASLAFAVVNGATTAALFGATAGKVEMDFTAASHPLPATLTVTGNLAGAPLLAVREA